jgi:hypothetical protein
MIACYVEKMDNKQDTDEKSKNKKLEREPTGEKSKNDPNFHLKSQIEELEHRYKQRLARETLEPQKRINTLSTVFIENLGVGKSTVLNAILGRVAFKAESDQSGNCCLDTPGLLDITMREKATQEIKKALTKGGEFKIIFTITLESVRTRPDDLTTIKLVLEAAPTIRESYSILINKVFKEVLSEWENEDRRVQFLELLNQGFSGTNHVFLNNFDRKCEAAGDEVVFKNGIS